MYFPLRDVSLGNGGNKNLYLYSYATHLKIGTKGGVLSLDVLQGLD